MNSLRNNVQLIGHVGIDPELKQTHNDKNYLSLPMATTERYSRNGEWISDTQWHRLVLWGKAAERAVKNLKKGSFIAVEGKIRYHTYVDAQGNTRHSTDIRVLHYMILSKKDRLEGSPDTDLYREYAEVTETSSQPSELQEDTEEVLPF